MRALSCSINGYLRGPPADESEFRALISTPLLDTQGLRLQHSTIFGVQSFSVQALRFWGSLQHAPLALQISRFRVVTPDDARMFSGHGTCKYLYLCHSCKGSLTTQALPSPFRHSLTSHITLETIEPPSHASHLMSRWPVGGSEMRSAWRRPEVS